MIMSTSPKKKKKNKVIKSPIKQSHLKKTTKIDANEFNELINKEEIHINSELFQKHFNL